MRKLALVAVVVASMATGSLIAFAAKPPANANADTYRQLDLFGDVFERVRAQYVDKVDDQKLIEAAINGMLSSLDAHSSYMSAKVFQEMQVNTRGEFGGLGLEVQLDPSGAVKVVAPIDDTPAARAGLKPNDLITALDHQTIQGLTLNEAVEKMRGPANSKVELTVVRPGKDEPIEMTLTRAVIKIESVKSRAEGNVGYVRITQFTEQTEDGLRKAIRGLREQIGPKIAGYVLDLRNNPGGLLEQAIAVSDTFLQSGEIVSTRGRNTDDTQRYNARGGDMIDGKPLIILINGGTASASEIVAGALQDHKRATVIGTRSFGKGSVQTIIPLSNQGAMRLTTARYYTPSGRSIQAKGIEPDIEVFGSREEREREAHLLSEANLANHLLSEDESKGHERSDRGVGQAKTPGPEAGPAADVPVKTACDTTVKPEDTAAKKKPEKQAEAAQEDPQLKYALDLLHSVTVSSKSKPL